MKQAPVVAIIMPLFDDESTVGASIESALAQTVENIEVVCVDDASTDATARVIEEYSARDSRVRLVTHDRNLSAFQARRTGILAATAEHILFLDGDDILAPHAVERVLATAEQAQADLVGFGVTVVEKDGRTGGSYELRLQPRHTSLSGPEVLPGLFPSDKPAQGQLWRYLFRTRVLREAYARLPEDLVLPRVNDLPLMFMVAALAQRYVSIPEKLYEYHFGRGGSGHDVDSLERAEFYVSAIRSIDAIAPAVAILEGDYEDSAALAISYESARLSMIGYVCSQLIDKSDSTILDGALAHLHTVASPQDVIHGAARFYPRVLTTLKYHSPWMPLPDRPVRNVMLATSTLRTGGVSAVIASQAQFLIEAGYHVTVVARSKGSDAAAVPEGVTFIELERRMVVDRMEEWGRICRDNAIDVVIDHQVLYTRYWPEFALMARAEGAATVGWVHNFVGRPIYDSSAHLSYIEECGNVLAHLVTLSPLDVAYFKLRGMEHVAYVPNPPSPLLLESQGRAIEKSIPSGRLELVWWGRLEQHTKQVTELISVAVQLKRLGVDFRFSVIGPNWDDMTAGKFNAQAKRRGVGNLVTAVGPRHGDALIRAIDSADAFVSTSIIEGYQLTIAEAQSRGLPVFMYDLPWLTLAQGNRGIVTAPQGDARALAHSIAAVARDADRYRALSVASVEAAQRALDHDFAALYEGVITGDLPERFSPLPTSTDAQHLLGLLVFYAERAHQGGARGGAVEPADGSAAGARIWAAAAPMGRETLKRLPGLRPLAHKAKRWLRAR